MKIGDKVLVKEDQPLSAFKIRKGENGVIIGKGNAFDFKVYFGKDTEITDRWGFFIKSELEVLKEIE